ncbi:MAG: CPBP family intramembrane glutamic endopeptidase [Alphaproteobacteria bacterium]
MTNSKRIAFLELAVFFFLTPIILYFTATRWNIHLALWLGSLYAICRLAKHNKATWHDVWHGQEWTKAQKKFALFRFLISTALVLLLTQYLAPERLLTFPMLRPGFWLLVMFLYPLLSVLPQELVFRSYFFRRYTIIFHKERTLLVLSAIAFAFVHIVFHNVVSPLLCLIAGYFFAHSYSQHRSLKWALIEHAAYGCMVFTAGIGFYFLVGGATRF